MDFRNFTEWFFEKWKKIVIWFICITSIPLLLYVIGWFYLDHELNKRLDAIRSKGYPTNSIKLAERYHAVADSDNMAFILKDAFRLYVEDVSVSNDMKNRQNYDEWFNNIDKETLDPQLLVFTGTADIQAYLSIGLPERILISSEIYLKANKEAVEKLHEAVKLPKCSFPIVFNNYYAIKLPHLSPMRQGGRLLAMEALLAAENENYEQSIDSILAIIKLANAFRHEPFILSSGVERAVNNSAFSTTQWLLNKRQLTDSQLLKLRSAWNQPEEESSLVRVLVGEQALFDDAEFDNFYSYYIFGKFANDSNQVWLQKMSVIFADYTGLKSINRINVLDYFARRIEIEKESLPAKLPAIERLMEDYGVKNIDYRVASWFLPSYSPVPCIAQTGKVRCLLTAIAIERYRLKYKKLPDALPALVPEFLNSIPLDPFDGQNLKYRKGIIKKSCLVSQTKEEMKKSAEIETQHRKRKFGDFSLGEPACPWGMKLENLSFSGYLIYSIGDDFEDDGGTPDKYGGLGRNSDITFTVIRQDAK